MNTSFSSQNGLLVAIRELLERRDHEFAGAQFRTAFVRNPDMHFLTARVLFQDDRVASRERRDYGYIVMAEDWVQGQTAALERLEQIIAGKGLIEDLRIDHDFTTAYLDRKLYAAIQGWAGWHFSSRVDQASRISLNQSPLLAHNCRPYWGPGEAIGEWVFDDNPSGRRVYGSSVPFENELITLIPDTRARIKSAEWIPGILNLEVETRVPPDQVQVQVLFPGSRDSYRIINVDGQIVQCEVPGDAQEIVIFLIHISGGCIATVQLRSVHDIYGERKQPLRPVQRPLDDLENGESENVEYKPWTSPMSAKESEIIETVVAFANTSGGRLYLGVDDRNGTPQGEPALHKALGANRQQALPDQIARIKSIVRERVKPVPSVKVEEAEAFGYPIVVVTVEQGPDRPYSTHDNKVLIRKGATNRLADPHTEIPNIAPQASVLDSFGYFR
jgi:Schlafen, AlbA_2